MQILPSEYGWGSSRQRIFFKKIKDKVTEICQGHYQGLKNKNKQKSSTPSNQGTQEFNQTKRNFKRKL